jgi:hypothetical protein
VKKEKGKRTSVEGVAIILFTGVPNMPNTRENLSISPVLDEILSRIKIPIGCTGVLFIFYRGGNSIQSAD